MGIKKYASNIACRAEFGRFPLLNKAKALAIKYWARLDKGTPNKFVNEAYCVAKELESEWFDAVAYSLSINGLLAYLLNSSRYTNEDMKETYQKRLDDQYIQKWLVSLAESSRFKILKTIGYSDYSIRKYLLYIKNPSIRKIFTRLRIDMNILGECQNRHRRNSNSESNHLSCLLCGQGIENVSHFILECSNNYLKQLREEMCSKLRCL